MRLNRDRPRGNQGQTGVTLFVRSTENGASLVCPRILCPRILNIHAAGVRGRWPRF